ncbi:hypothetical protein [Brevibacillus halotolerans]|uniref:hypothetical protein n=1 Tax=Brevibacillus halotolerans TaxID=1507437 RepID=UPI0015EF708B|nr:hypothetical protein [Brevibacillus halotolerans]
MKKLVSLFSIATLTIGLTIPWANTNVQASDLPASLSESSIVPDKVEYITSEKGDRVPVIYIADPDKAQQFMEDNGFGKESVIEEKDTIDNQKSEGIQPMAWDSYEFMDYVGPMKYQYKVDYTQNRTNKTFTWVREVSRAATSQTSIEVGGGFKDFFNAEIGHSWSDTETFKDTFTLNIPANKQGEIWTWNNAKVYKFKKKGLIRDTLFTATHVTNDFGRSILITDFRNPHGEIPR